MKKIFGLVAGLMMTFAVSAQSGVTFTDANADYNKTTTQTFHFDFSSNYTADQIKEGSQYYLDYFTVTVTEKDGGHAVEIKLVEDTEMSRRVVTRFFVTLGVENIGVNGTNMDVHEFVTQYILP